MFYKQIGVEKTVEDTPDGWIAQLQRLQVAALLLHAIRRIHALTAAASVYETNGSNEATYYCRHNWICEGF